MRPITVGLSRAVVLGRATGALPAGRDGATSVRIEGVITARDAGGLAVLDKSGVETRVRLGGKTRIAAIKGLLRLRRETRSSADLVAGLRVAVDGAPGDDGFEAAAITFRAADLKAIRAGAGA